MAKITIAEELVLHEQTINDSIAKYNKALRDKDLDAITEAETVLAKAEADYAASKYNEVCAQLTAQENPLKAAIIQHHYVVLRHKVLRKDGAITGFEVSEREVQVDLVKFCKDARLDATWQYTVEKFNQLLAVRAAHELGLSNSEIRKLKDSFYMNNLARAIDMGNTPDSNTAICKQLQQVIDAILFEDNGKGKNAHRVNNHDVAYLVMSYTRRGKKALSIAVAKNTFVHRLVADVFHRVLTGKVYTLEYQMTRNEASEPATQVPESETKAGSKAEPKKATTPKASKSTKSTKAKAVDAEPEVVEVEKTA